LPALIRVALGMYAAGLIGAGASPAGAATQVTISPLPGTPDASPRTQISFLGAPAGQLGSVSVVGSRSGRHPGKLVPYSTGQGASFLPDAPFSPGENVEVRVAATSAVAAADVRFSVAQPGQISGSPPIRRSNTRPVPPPEPHHYMSRADLQPPVLTVSTNHPGSSAPDLLLSPLPAPPPGQTPPSPDVLARGPVIYDARGEPVWFHPQVGGSAQHDLRVQNYHGAPVLTWWQGQFLFPYPGIGLGEDVIVDRSYREVARVRAGNGYAADFHDFTITPQGTAWLPVFGPVLTDLRSVGGDRVASMLDSIVQEIDIKTGLVMFEWHTLGHVALTDSNVAPLKNVVYDPTHLNSIQALADGRILISEKNTSAAYEINTRTGQIEWALGGDHSTFHLSPEAQFSWQHDVELQSNGTVTMFDDHHDEPQPPPRPPSRGLVLALDPQRHRATLAHQDRHRPPIAAGNEGNLQALPNGDRLVGWGSAPNTTEFSSAGHVVYDAAFQRPFSSYRAYRSAWTATPAVPPDIAVIGFPGTGRPTVYASWNGATEVASWQLLAGSVPLHLTPVASAPRSGFETGVTLRAPGLFYSVRALNASGQMLGTSQTVKPYPMLSATPPT
jgi:hypothetical protein